MNKGKEIEDKSMLIIDEFLNDTSFSLEELPIVRRILHTTGDPDYRKIISIQHNFVETAKTLFQNQPKIYCDTRMIEAGVNKRTLSKIGGQSSALLTMKRFLQRQKKQEILARLWLWMWQSTKGFAFLFLGMLRRHFFACFRELMKKKPRHFW